MVTDVNETSCGGSFHSIDKDRIIVSYTWKYYVICTLIKEKEGGHSGLFLIP